MTDDWPSHAEELTRKTSDTLTDLVYRLDQGEITEREAIVALGAIWDCTAGLVDRGVMDLVAQTRSELMRNQSCV